jgi:hypothetical protein
METPNEMIQTDIMEPPAWLLERIAAGTAGWNKANIERWREDTILVAVCRNCQCLAADCICDARAEDVIPVWRKGQGLNARLVTYLADKKRLHTAERATSNFGLRTPQSMRDRMTLWAAPTTEDGLDTFDDLFASHSAATVPLATKAPEKPALQGALHAALRGVRVAPVEPNAKRPRIKDFPLLATTDEKRIREWDSQFPNCNWLALATGDTVCFIDEDQSARFRALYEKAYSESFPRTLTTESQPDHRQSCWKQTDQTRAILNLAQSLFQDRMISFRQSNQYCLVAGSHLDDRPENGPICKHRDYVLADDSPIAEMPDKLADLIKSLLTKEAAENVERTGKSRVKLIINGKPVATQADEGFRNLWNAVGWEPLVRRLNEHIDSRFHDFTVGESEPNTYCPIPSHGEQDVNLHYTPCFGVIPKSPLLHCFGCNWTGDMVKACNAVDGGKAMMYDTARAICEEEGLKFEDFFPKPEAPAEAAAPEKKAQPRLTLHVFRTVEEVAAAKQLELGEAVAITSSAKEQAPQLEKYDRVIIWGESDSGNALRNAVGDAGVVVALPANKNGKPSRLTHSLPSHKSLVDAMTQYDAPSLKEFFRKTMALEAVSVSRSKTSTKAANASKQKEEYTLDFKYPIVEGNDDDCVLGLAMGASEGWFPRGDPHIVAGPSGSSKSTLIMEMLETQLRKESFLGHESFGLPYLVVMADRGQRAFRRTMKRMRIDPTKIHVERLRMARDAFAVQAILQKIEECNPLPAVVFIEGGDLLVTDASKMAVVDPFMDALQRIAFHYHISFIISTGAPKQKVGENYVAQRDQVIGSTCWARKAEAIVTMSYLDGDDTDSRRIVSVLLRNGAAERYKMKFESGRLVVDNAMPEDKPAVCPEIMWFKDQGWFTAIDLKEAFDKGKSTAYDCVRENLTKRILKTKKPPKGEARQYHWNEGKTNPLLGSVITLDGPASESKKGQKNG